jgi:hypothetical protein
VSETAGGGPAPVGARPDPAASLVAALVLGATLPIGAALLGRPAPLPAPSALSPAPLAPDPRLAPPVVEVAAMAAVAGEAFAEAEPPEPSTGTDGVELADAGLALEPLSEPPVEPPSGEAAPPPRRRPVREYAVPVARTSTGWPFGPAVYRWQPLVEAQLGALAATRRLDPLLTPELLLAVIAAESGGDPLAVSAAEAIGLMQVLPGTFADFYREEDPFDPVLNVRAGILYLHWSLVSHGGDLEWALAGYNAGINASLRARAGETTLWDETIDYVTQVLALRDRAYALRGLAPPVPTVPADLRLRSRETPAATTVAAATITATSTPPDLPPAGTPVGAAIPAPAEPPGPASTSVAAAASSVSPAAGRPAAPSTPAGLPAPTAAAAPPPATTVATAFGDHGSHCCHA